MPSRRPCEIKRCPRMPGELIYMVFWVSFFLTDLLLIEVKWVYNIMLQMYSRIIHYLYTMQNSRP